MNTRTLVASVAFVGAIAFTISASAVTSRVDVAAEVRTALGDSSSGVVNVYVEDNVAYLNGFSLPQDSAAAERAALATPGIDKVVNQITDAL